MNMHSETSIIHREPRIFLNNLQRILLLLKMVRNVTTRRAGGSEATVASQSWPQPGSRFAALRGSEGVGGSP